MFECVDKANLRPNDDPNRMLHCQALFHGIIASDQKVLYYCFEYMYVSMLKWLP